MFGANRYNVYFCILKTPSDMENRLNYKIIYDRLRHDIEGGAYASGALLPTEAVLSQKYNVSRPTVARAYNMLQDDGLVTKKKGMGTVVNAVGAAASRPVYGLLLPGAGESEIFSIINDRLLTLSKEENFDCIWDGATAGSANIRRELISGCCAGYIARKVDGVFFAPLERVGDAARLNREICDMLDSAGIPVVLIDRDICDLPGRSGYDVVSLDNFSAGCIMAQHLIERNCDDIHFFYRPDSAASVKVRLAGVRETLHAAGLPFPDANIHCGDPEAPDTVAAIAITKGRTGIICANDSTAAVLMSSLTGPGREISSDLLICAFDDMKYSRHLRHPLTSFRQPCTEIADTCVELMQRRIASPSAPPLLVLLEGTLIERESTIFK